MKKVLLALAVVAFVSGLAVRAHAWTANWRYVAGIEYQYYAGNLIYVIVRLSDTVGGSQKDFFYLGQNGMCNYSGSYNLPAYPDLVKVLNAVEAQKTAQKKIYVESYTNDLSCNSEKLLRQGHNFRFSVQ